jgi:regulator of protease activity HflC (stomatin/prohibitin superfamily)
MKLAGFTYFNFAGPNDFVALVRGGVEVAVGKGLAGWLRPSTSVAVVPLGVKVVNFQVTERSQDGQQITVAGELAVSYVPAMREKFDFSVFRENGQYRKDPTAEIEDQVRIAVRNPLRVALATMTLEQLAAGGVAELEEVLSAEVSDKTSELMRRLQANEIAVQSASVQSALPSDNKVAAAFGAEQREALLAKQDKAVADRRQKAAENDRSIREYEEATTLELVKKQALRVDQEGKNVVERAKAEALAEAAKLAVFAGMEPGAVLAQAVLKAAGSGIDRLSLDPSLLAAIRSAQ